MVQKSGRSDPSKGLAGGKSSKAAAKAAESGKAAVAPPPGAPPRKRGRPRAFEPEVALKKALAAFRKSGFSATSLDDLSAAMGINRPSLYGTFGDKRELFLKAYQRYRAETNALFAPALDPKLTLRQMLEMVYATAINIYLSGDHGPSGCFTVMTAASEAMSDPEIRAIVQKAIENSDRTIAGRFRAAMEQGELPPKTDCDALARIVSASIQSIAIRSRAHVPRAELEAMARSTIDLVAGPARR
ncbi:MAG: TetR family transcriptional regulator [Proteobacteria bacterium SG_bin9]|nr:MAG: TetR family transcriptional regulator [Proteobacteria bacterium SG_bin9]